MGAHGLVSKGRRAGGLLSGRRAPRSRGRDRGFRYPRLGQREAGSEDAPRAPGKSVKTKLLLLVFVVALAYQPVWHGGMLWDDDHHVTRAELQPVGGLRRIWTELGATQQYYPLAHSAFWIEHRFFGDETSGYHFVNIGLHVLSAFLLAL